MSEFVKPVSVNVSDEEYIKYLINVTLHKDLHENEEICPYCHGTGITVANNVYGLEGDPDKTNGMFPYNHQALTFCQHCYNGVIHRCKYCGKYIPKGNTRCNCEKSMNEWRNEIIQKEEDALEKAPIATQKILDESMFFYSDSYSNNDGYFEEWDDFFEDWHENHEYLDDKRPEYVWATSPIEMSMDADQIISNATEEMYEDAYYDVSDGKTKELQDYLDNWCKTCGVNTSYERTNYKVKIPWEDYKYDN